MRKCYYCQQPVDRIKGNCDYHAVTILHQFSDGDVLNGLALATTTHEVYLNFDDKVCEIYIKGKMSLQLDSLPHFTPDNMMDKIKTYLVFS